jgi:hypothetical protein
MRWVKDIPHNRYKISILAMGERMLLQVEDGPLVQTFKFKVPDELADVNQVSAVVNDFFLEKVSQNFHKMQEVRQKALTNEENLDEFSFPEII